MAINSIEINITPASQSILQSLESILPSWQSIALESILPASQSAHGDQKLKPTKENAARNRRPERKMEARLTKTIKNNHDDEETDDHKDVNDC